MRPIKTRKLTDEEIRSLGFIADRYSSGDYLYRAYDEDTGEWDTSKVYLAYAATAQDGGNLGTVPLLRGSLKRLVDDLFIKVVNKSDHLPVHIQVEAEEMMERKKNPRLRKRNPEYPTEFYSLVDAVTQLRAYGFNRMDVIDMFQSGELKLKKRGGHSFIESTRNPRRVVRKTKTTRNPKKKITKIKRK